MTRRAPIPSHLARQVGRLHKALSEPGADKILELAEVLAARGWPSTGGSSGVPDDDADVPLTSVERAAFTVNRWDQIDILLQVQLVTTWDAVVRLLATIGEVTAHTDPDEAHRSNRPGAGSCMACGDFASGGKNDRLRSGLDNKCYMAWARAGRPDHFTWVLQRKAALAAKSKRVDPAEPGALADAS